MSATTKRNRDWYKTLAGADCAWCFGRDFEPFDCDDADATLCRGHLAEYEGTSLDGLDREDAAMRADAGDLGVILRFPGFPPIRGVGPVITAIES